MDINKIAGTNIIPKSTSDAVRQIREEDAAKSKVVNQPVDYKETEKGKTIDTQA